MQARVESVCAFIPAASRNPFKKRIFSIARSIAVYFYAEYHLSVSHGTHPYSCIFRTKINAAVLACANFTEGTKHVLFYAL